MVDRAVLAGPEAAAQRIDRPISRRSDCLPLGGPMPRPPQDVGHAEIGFAAADQRDQHRFAGGRLHQDIQAALLLQHLGDGRGDGVASVPGCMVASRRSAPTPHCCRVSSRPGQRWQFSTRGTFAPKSSSARKNPPFVIVALGRIILAIKSSFGPLVVDSLTDCKRPQRP